MISVSHILVSIRMRLRALRKAEGALESKWGPSKGFGLSPTKLAMSWFPIWHNLFQHLYELFELFCVKHVFF